MPVFFKFNAFTAWKVSKYRPERTPFWTLFTQLSLIWVTKCHLKAFNFGSTFLFNKTFFCEWKWNLFQKFSLLWKTFLYEFLDNCWNNIKHRKILVWFDSRLVKPDLISNIIDSASELPNEKPNDWKYRFW